MSRTGLLAAVAAGVVAGGVVAVGAPSAGDGGLAPFGIASASLLEVDGGVVQVWQLPVEVEGQGDEQGEDGQQGDVNDATVNP